jgi:phasin
MAATRTDTFEIPPEMRDFAEKSVAQAKQALETFMTSAQRAANAFEGQAKATHQGARDIGQKALAFAERNVESSFELAQKLMRAKDVEEMLKLQGDYIKSQMQALSEQAKELGASTTQMAKDAAKPPL